MTAVRLGRLVRKKVTVLPAAEVTVVGMPTSVVTA